MINFPPLRLVWDQTNNNDAGTRPHLQLQLADITLYRTYNYLFPSEASVELRVRDLWERRHTLRNIITTMGIVLHFLQHEKCPRTTKYRPRGTWAPPVLDDFVHTHIRRRQLPDFRRTNRHGKVWYTSEFWHVYHAMVGSTLLREVRGSNRKADAALYLNIEHPLVISFEVDRATNPERYGIEPQAQGVVVEATPPKRIAKKRRSVYIF